MKARSVEQGSGHLLIVFGVIVIILGALGVLFWQNLQSENDTSIQTQTTKNDKSQVKTEQSNVTYVDGAISEDFGTLLVFTYPDTWQYKSVISGDKANAWVEEITLTSPRKKFNVVYRIGSGGGIGGTCDSSSNGKVANFNYQVLDNMPELSLVGYEVEGPGNDATGSDQPGNYQREAIGTLFKTDRAKSIVAGDSACELGYGDVYTLQNGDVDGGKKTVLLYSSRIELMTTDADMTSDEDGELQQAKEILLSTAR